MDPPIERVDPPIERSALTPRAPPCALGSPAATFAPAPRMAASARRDDSSDALYAATGGRFLVDDVASLARISFRRNSAPLMSYSTLESSASSSASRPFHVRPARSIGGAAGVSAWVSQGERPRGEGFGGARGCSPFSLSSLSRTRSHSSLMAASIVSSGAPSSSGRGASGDSSNRCPLDVEEPPR